MGKIGDLWVKLGLKKDEFDAGMKASESKLAGFGNSIKGLAVSAAAAWAAIGAGLVALADKFAHESQRFGDAWDKAMGGMKSAWRSFTSTLSAWDWENFGERMRASFNAGKELAQARDAVFEVENSINIRRSGMAKELAELQIEMRSTKNSYEQRAKYAEDYLEKVRPLYEDEIELRKELAEATSNDFLANGGIAQDDSTRKLLNRFLTDIAPKKGLLEAFDAVRRSKTSAAAAVALTSEQKQAVKDALAQYNAQDQATITKLADYYFRQSNDKRVKELVDAIVKYNTAIAAFDEETRRIQVIKNQAGANGGGVVADTAPKKIDWVNYINIDELDRVIKEANAAIMEGLGDLENPLDDLFDDSHLGQAQDYFDRLAELEQIAIDRAQEFKSAVADGMASGIQELTDQLAGLDSMNAGAIFQQLLGPLADMAIREGQIVLAQGIAVKAVKTSLESLNGAAAIAAGTALIAIGAAAKSGLSALASSGSASTSTSSGASASTSTQNIESELTVYVKGTIKGSNILISGAKTQKAWSR